MLEVRSLICRHVRVDALDVPEGGCVAVMGPSGAGKSLLLRAIVDIEPNDAEIRLGDVDRDTTPAWSWRRLVGYVPAESGWWSDLVGDHFADPEAAIPHLHALGLPGEAMNWHVARLSSGERQRLALSRALAVGPSALLLDEPTSSLDETATEAAELLIARFRQEGRPVIVVTHDRVQADRMASRVIEIREGRVLEEAGP